MFQFLPYLGALFGTAVAGTQVIVGSETIAGSFTTYALGPRLGLTAEAVAAEPKLPRSWQAPHPNLAVVYTVDQLAPPGLAGGVSAYTLDPRTGAVAPHGPSGVAVGDAPVCAVVVDAVSGSEDLVTDSDGGGDGDGGFAVAVAVYASGSLAVIALDEAGKLVGAPMITNHTGHSACTTPPASTRQTSPHPHGVFTHPVRKGLIFSPDLGLDRIYQYRVVAGRGLVPLPVPYVKAETCSGPRHMAFSPSGAWAAVLHEMGNTLSVYGWDDAKNTLTAKPVAPATSTLPDGEGWKYCVSDNYTSALCTKAAEVRTLSLSPTTTAVFVTNRGHNSIRLFLLDEATGQLSPGPFVPSGQWPRGLNVVDKTATSPALLIVAARGGWGDTLAPNTGTLTVFAVDPTTGELIKRSSTAADSPVDISVSG